MISYEKELDIDNKLHNYLKITGIINNVFKPQETLKKTRIKLYNTLALPVLLYGMTEITDAFYQLLTVVVLFVAVQLLSPCLFVSKCIFLPILYLQVP